MKAKLCVRGADLLYKYCDKTGVPYKRVGKVVCWCVFVCVCVGVYLRVGWKGQAS